MQGQCYARELYAGCADGPLVPCTWCRRPMHEACGGELHGKRACWICLPMQGVEHDIDGLLLHHAHARYEDRCTSLFCPGSLVRGGSHRCEVCHDVVHGFCGVPHAEKGQMYRTCHQCAFGKPSHCPFCEQQLQQQWDASRAHIHACWQRNHALRGRCKLCAPPNSGDGTGGASGQATAAGSSTGSDNGGGGDSSGDSSGSATGGGTGGGTRSVLAHRRIRCVTSLGPCDESLTVGLLLCCCRVQLTQGITPAQVKAKGYNPNYASWRRLTITSQPQLQLRREFADDFVGQRFKAVMRRFSGNVRRYISTHKLPNSHVGFIRAFFTPAVAAQFQQHTAAALAKKNQQPWQPWEFWQFLGTLLVATQFKTWKLAWNAMGAQCSSHGCIPMDQSRFTAIHHALRTTPPMQVRGQRETTACVPGTRNASAWVLGIAGCC